MAVHIRSFCKRSSISGPTNAMHLPKTQVIIHILYIYGTLCWVLYVRGERSCKSNGDVSLMNAGSFHSSRESRIWPRLPALEINPVPETSSRKLDSNWTRSRQEHVELAGSRVMARACIGREVCQTETDADDCERKGYALESRVRADHKALNTES